MEYNGIQMDLDGVKIIFKGKNACVLLRRKGEDLYGKEHRRHRVSTGGAPYVFLLLLFGLWNPLFLNCAVFTLLTQNYATSVRRSYRST